MLWSAFTLFGSSIDIDVDNFVGGETQETASRALSGVANAAIEGSISIRNESGGEMLVTAKGTLAEPEPEPEPAPAAKAKATSKPKAKATRPKAKAKPAKAKAKAKAKARPAMAKAKPPKAKAKAKAKAKPAKPGRKR